MIVGASSAVVGTCILHECGHRTFASSARVNYLFACISSLPLGMSPTIWMLEHTRHHRCPNVHDEDPDVAQNSLLRFAPHQTWRPAYRWQHVYIWPLYGWVVVSRIWGKEIRHSVRNSFALRGRAHARLIAEMTLLRAVHLGLLFGLPAYVHASLGVGLAYYLISMYALGLVFAFAFQMSHINARCRFPASKDEQRRDWAARQLETTVNWGADWPWMNWLSGGLNLQVVHHLFLGVHHLHFLEIRKIIVAYCEEQGLALHEHGGVRSSLVEHYQTIRALGRRPA